MAFVYQRLIFDNDIQYINEWKLPPSVYAFIETDPNVEGVGNKYAFVINYITGTSNFQSDARIKIYYINRDTERLDYLTTVLLSATYGKTVEQVAGMFVPFVPVLEPVDNDAPVEGFGDFNDDFNNDFLIS